MTARPGVLLAPRKPTIGSPLPTAMAYGSPSVKTARIGRCVVQIQQRLRLILRLILRLVLLLRRLLLIGVYQVCQVRRSRPAEARGCRCLSQRLRQEHPLSPRSQVKICAVSQPLRTSL
jgi:hypothetical protein